MRHFQLTNDLRRLLLLGDVKQMPRGNMGLRRMSNDDRNQLQFLAEPTVYLLNVCVVQFLKSHRAWQLGQLVKSAATHDDHAECVKYVNYRPRLIANGLKYLDSHQNLESHRPLEAQLLVRRRNAQPYIQLLQLRG